MTDVPLRSRSARLPIETYTRVARPFIRSALSVLGAHGLVQIERFDSAVSDSGVANAYRLSHVDSYRHIGTIGRADPFAAFAGLDDLQRETDRVGPVRSPSA